MSKTKHFQLDGLDPFQYTNQDLNEDIRRFTTIDNNLYALFKIFGNGVIVLDSSEFPLYVELLTGADAIKQINVSPGRAFVNYNSINYTTTTTLTLPTQTGINSIQKYYLYLKSNANTPSTELGDFFFSAVQQPIADTYIGLGSVLINYAAGTAQFFDDSANGRQLLNVKNLFLSFINDHYHTGGLGSPKKIDLQNETVGNINDTNILSVDVSKVRGGQLSKFVTPQIDHNYLQNSGNLSHAQLDSAILSFRDHLNLEIVAAVNNLKVYAKIIRSTTESYSPPTFPSGPLATVDKGLNNIFVYCPNISNDYYAVGYSGSTGAAWFNPSAGSSGPFYVATPFSSMAECNRVNNLITLESPVLTGSQVTGSVQKIFTLQAIDPNTKLTNAGLSGYFYGFVPGLDKISNLGDAHLIHYLAGQTGPTGGVIENYAQYTLSDIERFNTSGIYGDSGVQIACLLTNLLDFPAINVFNYSNNNNILLCSGSTGPRVLSPYQNGYFDSVQPVDILPNFSGPYTGPTAFYYEATSGPKSVLFNTGQCLTNLNGTTWSFTGSANGRYVKYNGKLTLLSFAGGTLNLYELGPNGVLNTVNIDTGTSMMAGAVSYYIDSNNYRVFYVDNGQLHLSVNGTITGLGYFGNVTDLQVKYGILWILVNNTTDSQLYYAYEAGQPTTFNEIILNTAAPASAKFDVFQAASGTPIYISVVSSGKYQVFDLSGQELYQYQQGKAGVTGPVVSSIYMQFNLGDATLDMKY